MNKFEIFDNVYLGSVRTMFDAETGEAWFFANDVAKILGYKRINEAVLDHTSLSDRKALKYKAYAKTAQAELWGKNDFMDKVFINESGLYCLIFGSKLPAAQEFKRWVTKEVLPSIRRHGGYVYGQEKLNDDERNELMLQIEKLSKNVEAYKADGDLWMKMYFNLEKDYLKAVSVAIPEETASKDVTPAEATQKYIITGEGYIIEKNLYYDMDEER